MTQYSPSRESLLFAQINIDGSYTVSLYTYFSSLPLQVYTTVLFNPSGQLVFELIRRRDVYLSVSSESFHHYLSFPRSGTKPIQITRIIESEAVDVLPRVFLSKLSSISSRSESDIH